MGASNDKTTIWRERIQACLASGVTIKKWCRDNDIVYPTYKYWQAKLGFRRTPFQRQPTLNRGSFAELTDAPCSELAGVEIAVGEKTIRLRKGFDENSLRSCLRILGG
jgi:hypothetical protein